MSTKEHNTVTGMGLTGGSLFNPTIPRVMLSILSEKNSYSLFSVSLFLPVLLMFFSSDLHSLLTTLHVLIITHLWSAKLSLSSPYHLIPCPVKSWTPPHRPPWIMLLSKPSSVIIAGFAMTTSCLIQELLLTDVLRLAV